MTVSVDLTTTYIHYSIKLQYYVNENKNALSILFRRNSIEIQSK